ncbi:hypothetical protein ATANTOWER_031938 [Ataeniobius toweri]|uniref:Transposase n=1 Tax=Ataeniobius toweri TaxID=208326 RepID=A0ABU7BTP5_9TELE|nr:hypothetical protein [Ataeniobius toweri]
MLQFYRHSVDNTGALPRNVLVVDGVAVCQKKCFNRFIRSLLQEVALPSGRFYWSSLYGEIDWNLVWLIGEKYCLNYKGSCGFLQQLWYRFGHGDFPLSLNTTFTLSFRLGSNAHRLPTYKILELPLTSLSCAARNCEVQHFLRVRA